ncbi:SORD [Branchiostoma lanceolatum]|uniref:SORD protein n=1 Tax=Branchiostoma lanceolatum TaxID=7740 RepID=A0A8J9VHY9_BRALA|nr:SORD [Branchiostoma lanceolatum]
MMATTMKALQWDAKSEKLSMVEVPVPTVTNPFDVVVKVGFVGVCGSDLLVLRKIHPAAEKVILGHEFAGTVHAVGTMVSSLQVGDRVCVNPNGNCNGCRFCIRGQPHFCTTGKSAKNIRDLGIFWDGAMADFCMVPADQVFRIPDDMSIQQAVLCEPYSCVIHGYERISPLLPETRILILGAGIIGMLFAALFQHRGFPDVTVSEPSELRRKTVSRIGKGCRGVSPTELKSLSTEKDAEDVGFDVIVDTSGVPMATQQAIPLLRHGGKLLIFGCCPADKQLSFNPHDAWMKEITILTSRINPFCFPKAIGLVNNMAADYLSFEKLGVKVFSMHDYQDAIEMLKKGEITKALMEPSGLGECNNV